jgi:hypothetical protein
MDPITTSLLVAQGLAGLGKTGYGLYQQRAGREALAGVQEASRMKPDEYAQMLREAKKGQAVQARIDAINRSLASSTDALQQAGSRAVIGGIGKVTQAGTTATNQLLGQQQQDIMRALGASAMGSERQIARDTQREMQEKGLAQAAINAGVQNTVGGIADIGSAIGYGASISDGSNKTDLTPEVDMLELPSKEVDIQMPEVNAGLPEVDTQAILSMYQPNSAGLGTLTPEEEEAAMRAIQKMNNFQSGGMVTDGAFNHDTNPIYMMQGGQVVGEMTGGEYVLNPKQAKAISKESKYFRNLLKQKRFK